LQNVSGGRRSPRYFMAQEVAVSLFLLAALAIGAPDSSATPSAAETSVNWDRVVLAALKQHAQDRLKEPRQAAARLADVGKKLAADQQVSEPNRRRLLRQIHRRLTVNGQHILAQQIQRQAGLGDVGGQRGAEALKSLIEQTIEPDSWDVNGGPGHIHVFKE